MTVPAIFVRVDASSRTGGGHLSRCLALADAFAGKGCEVRFLCGDLDDGYANLIAHRGYELLRLADASPTKDDFGARTEEDATASISALLSAAPARRMLIVDHYFLDARWEQKVGAHVDCLLVIDDLANRPHACRILLDQTFEGGSSRYDGLVPEGCRFLLGPEYALLRPSFARLRTLARSEPDFEGGLVVHVFFGSEDVRENTRRFCGVLMTIDRVREVRAAVSRQYRQTEGLELLRARHPKQFSWRIPDEAMAEHMAACDVAVGAPGQATWERACLGLPAAYLATSETQIPILRHLDSAGFCKYLGVDQKLSDDEFRTAVGRFLGDVSELRRMRLQSMKAVDGLGAPRAAEAALAC